MLGAAFDVKVLPRYGPPGFGGQAVEGVHLGRTIDLTPRGFTWCGSGSGKVRHHTNKELWVQEAPRKCEFSLRVVDTLLNWADVGTKSLEKDHRDSLMLQMLLSRGEERMAVVAVAAPSCLPVSPFNENNET